jgi:FHS family glucose/mannose:H+ symporter-like MFS transporter
MATVYSKDSTVPPDPIAKPPDSTATGFTLRDRALLYAGFTATGVSLALPGGLMPWLLAHWSLQDSQAGLLLFLFFLGGTSGALLTRGALRWSVVRGAACTALGAAWLPFATRHTAYAAILLYGLGLGITMTSISLLQARRFVADCAAEMTRLNLLWAIGACCGPWLILHDGLLDGAHARYVLLAIALGFGLFALLSVAFESDAPAQPDFTEPSTQRSTNRSWMLASPSPLLLLVFCITGVESSSGSWLATYSQRGGHSLGITIGAPTCFWAGLLISRLLHSSSRVSNAARRFLLTWNIVLMAAALGSLIVFHASTVMLTAAFVIGFTAGPMYPLLLALVLEHDTGPSVFVLAGLGSAAVPFLTGSLSTYAGSLRTGLLVPTAAVLAMVIAGWLTANSCSSHRKPYQPRE